MSIFSFINVSEDVPFLALSASFLLVAPTSFPEKISLFMGIVAMWLFLCDNKKKVADMLIAHDSKITNDLSARDSKIKTDFTVELGKTNSVYTAEAQKILSMIDNVTTRLNTIEEACRNDFASVNISIEALQNGLIRCYTINRRIQPAETDQQSVSNHSEASSGSSSSSSPITFKGISLTIWTQFKEIFDKIKAEKRFNLEEMCLHVAMEIRQLGGNIKKATVQAFYERNIKKKDGYISTLDDIGLWLDSKLSVNNNASSANNNNNENNMG